MSRVLTLLIALLMGVAIGYAFWGDRSDRPTAPGDWVARVGDEYVTRSEFINEMERRGGRRPGQYQSVDQRRLLLNEMIIRKALVDAAQREDFAAVPEVRRALDSVLINRYRQTRLQPLRDAITISDEEVSAYYEQHADDYKVPARKRIAVIHIEVPEGAPEAQWGNARQRAEAALAEVAGEDLPVPHFGDVARRYSDDQGSRYRGGVVGWLSENAVRPRFNDVVAESAAALDTPGETSSVLRSNDGFYIVRLVQSEPGRARSLEQLSSGIRQRIFAEKLREVETEFLDLRLAAVETEVNQAAVEAIEPLSSPGRRREAPPSGPTNAEDER